MTATLSITELNYLTQNTDHHTVILFFLIYLIGDQCDQSSLFRIKLDCIIYSPVYNTCIKWTVDIIWNTHFISSSNSLCRIFTGNHNNRDIFQIMVMIHIIQDTKSIHARHNNIQKHKWNTCFILTKHINTCVSAVSLYNIVFLI